MFKIYFSNTKIELHTPKHTQSAMNVCLCLTLVLFGKYLASKLNFMTRKKYQACKPNRQ